jgi:hypothetical protein
MKLTTKILTGSGRGGEDSPSCVGALEGSLDDLRTGWAYGEGNQFS